MKKIAVGFFCILMLGCSTIVPDYSMVSGDVRKVTYKKEGKIVSTHYEMREWVLTPEGKKSHLAGWFKAQKIGSEWVLTPKGKEALRLELNPGMC